MRTRTLGKILVGFLLLAPLAQAARPLNPYTGIMEQSARIESIQSLCASMKLNYAGWELKKHITLGEGYLRDPQGPRAAETVAVGENICAAAEADEQNIADPTPGDAFAIAKHNLDFGDRVMKLAAKFKDTHFVLQRIQTRTDVTLGFDLKRLKNHYFVSAVSAYLQSALSFTAQISLAVGDEILSFDGQALSLMAQELSPFISASSEAALETSQTIALTYRNFSYPRKGRIEVTWRRLKTGEVVHANIPWVYGEIDQNHGHALHRDDLAYLQNIGAVEEYSIFFRQSATDSNHQVFFPGANDTESNIALLGNVENLETVKAAGGNLIAQKGVVSDKFMWIQLRNFFDWKTISGFAGQENYKSEFTEALKKWLKESKDLQLPVVLDLRFNPGGDMSLLTELIAHLLPKRETATPATRAVPINDAMMDAFTSTVDPQLKMQGDLPDEGSYEIGFIENFFKSLRMDLSHQSFLSPLFRNKIIQSKGTLPSPLSLLVWTGPLCVSSCELAVMSLKKNKLAKIMGQPTNGTGMGHFSSAYSTVGVKLSDSRQIFASNYMPNSYFGPPNDCASSDGIDANPDLLARVKHISENRPMAVDLPYEETPEDLTKNGAG